MLVNYRESQVSVSNFLQQTGWRHPTLLDTTGTIYQAYQLNGNISPFPLDFIIDQTGIIAYGATEYSPLAMRTTIDHLLGISGANQIPTSSLPSSIRMSAFPNPFNPTSTISYSLPKSGNVELKLFDLTGREVNTVQTGFQPAGIHFATINGSSLTSGTYFVRLQSGSTVQTRKVVLLR